MKNFKEFINEGVRDMMTPKSEEDVKKALDGLSPIEKINKIFSYNIQDRFEKEELDNLLKELTPDEKISIGCDHNLLWLVKSGFEEGGKLNPNEINYAVVRGFVDIIKCLCENGYKNKLHEYQKYYLLSAIKGGHAEMVDLFVNEYNFDINIINKLHISKVIEWITSKKYIDMVKVLTTKSPVLREKLIKKSKEFEENSKLINQCL